MSEPYKTPLTEATELNWQIRNLAADPSNKQLKVDIEKLAKEFFKYIDAYNKN